MTRTEILSQSFSEPFVEKMRNAIEMSHYKYGSARKTYPELTQAHKCAKGGNIMVQFHETIMGNELCKLATRALQKFLNKKQKTQFAVTVPLSMTESKINETVKGGARYVDSVVYAADHRVTLIFEEETHGKD